MAAGYVFFITPHRIVPGGVYGISIVLHYLTEGMFRWAPAGLPIGVMGLIMNIPLYSWLTIFITGKVIDATINGANYNKSVFIISEKYEEIQTVIIKNLNRGGTLLKGTGLFDEKDKPVLFTNVSRRELVMLENHIKEIDENAFLTVMDAKEILGNGFKPLKEV